MASKSATFLVVAVLLACVAVHAMDEKAAATSTVTTKTLSAVTSTFQAVVSRMHAKSTWLGSRSPHMFKIFYHGHKAAKPPRRTMLRPSPAVRRHHPPHGHFAARFNNHKMKTKKRKKHSGDDDDDDDDDDVMPKIIDAKSCVFTLRGQKFDLSALTKSGKHDYTAQDKRGQLYKVNVCGATRSTGTECRKSHGMVCEYSRHRHRQKLTGVVMRWKSSPAPKWSFIDDEDMHSGVMMTAMNGDSCHVLMGLMKKKRTASILFPCDHHADPVGQISVQASDSCNQMITIPTKYACTGQVGWSHGWVFIISLVTLTLIYVVGGSLYNYLKKTPEDEASPTTILPNVEFWKSFPGYVKDGFKFTSHTMSCFLCKMKGKGKSGDADPDDAADTHESKEYDD